MPNTQHYILPRLLRLKDAPSYLGMNKNLFNQLVRPYLISIPIGVQGIAFDRIDLDDFAEQYKFCNGRPCQKTGEIIWDVKERPAFASAKGSGISTSKLVDGAFAEAVKQVRLKKPSGA